MASELRFEYDTISLRASGFKNVGRTRALRIPIATTNVVVNSFLVLSPFQRLAWIQQGQLAHIPSYFEMNNSLILKNMVWKYAFVVILNQRWALTRGKNVCNFVPAQWKTAVSRVFIVLQCPQRQNSWNCSHVWNNRPVIPTSLWLNVAAMSDEGPKTNLKHRFELSKAHFPWKIAVERRNS